MAGPRPELIDGAYAYELRTAAVLHDGLNLADMAHLLQLGADGIVPRSAAVAAGRRTRAGRCDRDGRTSATRPPPASRTTRARAAASSHEIGHGAGWLHAGRPRREATRVAFRLHLRREVCVARPGRGASGARRSRDGDGSTGPRLFADHTYLQPAQPSTVGHYLTSFAYPVLRDAERLLGVVAWLNGSPCGAGAVNGSRLVADRERTAAVLGFDHVIVNTRDAMWQVDGLIDLGSTITSLACTQTSLAEDLEIWASDEFGYVELGSGYARTSVLMPQKRNPYALSMIRGTAGVLIGRLAGLLAVQKSPSARSDSLIMAYGEVPAMVDEARRTTELTAGVVETLAIDEARLRETLEAGSTQATDLADELMRRCGLDYRRAYLVAGRALRLLADTGAPARQLTPDVLDAAAAEVIGGPLAKDPGDLGEALDPEAIVATRSAPGGAAPAAVDEMADEIDSRRRALVAAAEAYLARFDAAETALRETASARRQGRRNDGPRRDSSDRSRGRRDPDAARRRRRRERRSAHVRGRRRRAGPRRGHRRLAHPAGGEPELVAALARLYGRRSRSVDAANVEVVRRLDEGVPHLVDVVPAGTVVPGFGGRMLLHCGPPLDYADACDPLRRSMRAAVVAEGWAATCDEADRMLGRR